MSKDVHPLVAELRRIRRSRDILQRELGETMGYSRVMISKWEKGHLVPNLSQAQDWAQALGYEIRLEQR